jgi:hypothetical protein
MIRIVAFINIIEVIALHILDIFYSLVLVLIYIKNENYFKVYFDIHNYWDWNLSTPVKSVSKMKPITIPTVNS